MKWVALWLYVWGTVITGSYVFTTIPGGDLRAKLYGSIAWPITVPIAVVWRGARP